MSEQLRCTMNTLDMSEQVLRDFKNQIQDHERPETAFEHGQWHVSCSACGAMWSVNDLGDKDFDFDEIAHGDESCLENMLSDHDEEDAEDEEDL